MNQNIEKEYKVLLTKEQFHILTKQYDHLVFIRQINTYYDTEDWQIRKNYGSMRIREKEGHFIFTLKKHTNEGLMEFEKEVFENSILAFEDSEIKALLLELNIKSPIVELTSLTTDRAVIFNGYAEICFDHNMYHGIEDYEIEYEYKKEHDGLRMFEDILKPLNIHYEKNCVSKSKRALSTL
ncbi:CYTH domain-containing protein [[Eubacterium] hominis]|uniref:CYTH domain-containing protein n=1 Tax=[Eubacterium] hominis TaxID=2764325 RepID=UPI003A4DCD2D